MYCKVIFSHSFSLEKCHQKSITFKNEKMTVYENYYGFALIIIIYLINNVEKST